MFVYIYTHLPKYIYIYTQHRQKLETEIKKKQRQNKKYCILYILACQELITKTCGSYFVRRS